MLPKGNVLNQISPIECLGNGFSPKRHMYGSNLQGK